MSNKSILDKILRYLRFKQACPYVNKGAVMCDLGCGSGSVLMSLSSKIKLGYGLDYDASILPPSKDNLYFICADIAKPLPMPDGVADVVTLLAVLEHLESANDVIKEIRRILKPGGRLILTTPAPQSKKLLEFLAFKLGMISKEGVLDHKHYYSKEELKNLLLKFGLKIIKIKYFELGLNLLAAAEK